MKKIIYVSLTVLLFTTVLKGQTSTVSLKNDMKATKHQETVLHKEINTNRKDLRKLETADVSYFAKDQFSRDFNNVTNVNWQHTPYFDEATFVKDGQVYSAFYDEDAKLVGTTTEKTFKDLPADAQRFIHEKYKDYSVVDIILFDDNEFNDTDMMLYNQQFEDEDNYFVELRKDNQKIVLQVDLEGWVYFFTRLT